jgi:hypothetical protein
MFHVQVAELRPLLDITFHNFVKEEVMHRWHLQARSFFTTRLEGERLQMKPRPFKNRAPSSRVVKQLAHGRGFRLSSA